MTMGAAWGAGSSAPANEMHVLGHAAVCMAVGWPFWVML